MPYYNGETGSPFYCNGEKMVINYRNNLYIYYIHVYIGVIPGALTVESEGL